MGFKKLPYGLPNFADLIESGYAYVDKTNFIELLENENNRTQIFLRPRRFGKSLFLSVLENYYDMGGKDKFESLFGNLYIGKHPTPEQGMYAILKFDFSGLDTANSREEFKTSFLNRVEDSVIAFFDRYENIFTNAAVESKRIAEQKPRIEALGFAYRAAAKADVKLFVMIDEYDHFSNNLIAMGETYNDEVKAGGIVKAFYERLKSGTTSVVRRMFITGMSPMMLSDLASSFNMSTNYSLTEKYNEMFGFTKEEVQWLIQETGVDKNLITVDMEYYYNGYKFHKDAKNKVYNSQMVLYLFDQILFSGKQPEQIIDPNLRTDPQRLHRFAEDENNLKTILSIIENGGISARINDVFSLDNLNRSEYFVSYLFYIGMLTNGGGFLGETYLKIPNYSIKTLYWEYLALHIQNLEKNTTRYDNFKKTVREMALHGTVESYLDFFSGSILNHLSNRDLTKFDEKYIKAMLLANLLMSNLYLPKSEDENINGYTDIYLQKHPAIKDIKYEYVFEIKYIKANTDKKEKDSKLAEAIGQIEKYKKDPRFANRTDLKFFALIFEGKGTYEVAEV
ncbi:MAG: ATP-binding protein [Chitinispirillales bacterium]|jgi:hypothetical protein|nr:ATP-binding protein [Chitinispirillales bacterium]